jgi:hypothetical protein
LTERVRPGGPSSGTTFYKRETDMPIGYFDVPTGADISRKSALVKAMYEAMHEVHPFPDYTRIFCASGRSKA